ncbi:MAG: SDR family oxidoreductase [Acidobacteriota bacterium]|nr:SDR family oxidoreductase [Acidobacteriota bacterium]
MILVVGATGRLGGTIAGRLLQQGEQVRALVRSESNHATLAERGAHIVFGDLRDAASLEAACRGCDRVITTANSARRSGADTVDTVDRDGTRGLIDAAAHAGVRQFMYTSVLGVDPASPVPFLAAKAQNEAHLRASGLSWTILAPNAFMESWPLMVVGMPATMGQPVTLVGSGHRRHTFVAEADVAAFAVAAITDARARDRHIPIGGPDALSWRDVVAVYERVLGRSLEVRFVAPGEAVPGIPPAVTPLLAAMETYDTVFDAAAAADEFGVMLTPLEALVRQSLAAGGSSH